MIKIYGFIYAFNKTYLPGLPIVGSVPLVIVRQMRVGEDTQQPVHRIVVDRLQLAGGVDKNWFATLSLKSQNLVIISFR